MVQIKYKLKDGTQQTITGCTFCGEASTPEKPVVAGPMVFICQDCVHIAQDIFDEDRESKAPTGADKVEG